MNLDNSAINRENVTKEINELLLSYGFKTSNIYDRSCFDLLARKDDILIILKILVNVDSLTSTQAEELSKIAGTFLASPIIIGLKSKHNYLEEDVVYERHELPVITPQTLCNIIVNDIHPEIFAKRGGYYVKINGELLRQFREQKNLSLKELADMSHVSRETIYRYEQGNSQTYPETALMLEEVLQKPITLSINLLDVKNNNSLDKRIQEPKELIKLGYDIKSSKKTPFDAVSESTKNAKDITKLQEKLENKLDEIEKIRAEINKKTRENHILITNLEKGRNTRTLNNIANKTRDISSVTGYDALFVLENKQDKENIEEIPAIYTWEIKDMENIEDLLKLIKERKNEAE
ncbi:MAG: transcriptional regulator [Methanosphaera sp.]|uniref:transcriptional regulator n=1 Tax=Methanosphaera sp. ISO3-F5 TaxID=1452353 RepID=UPI002B259C11|nr:transcriptional regulator [Methanosphaera sp. ISO3-F5]MBR0473088.1 transcriptional regulator [Methanosphaera sp.]WQH64582.1 transcriptional regulator [Methanosphaera sp. ISO3-F5]